MQTIKNERIRNQQVYTGGSIFKVSFRQKENDPTWKFKDEERNKEQWKWKLCDQI